MKDKNKMNMKKFTPKDKINKGKGKALMTQKCNGTSLDYYHTLTYLHTLNWIT